jgi:anti-anti-sigma factor
MRVETSRQDDVLIVYPVGRMDTIGGPAVQQVLDSFEQPDCPHRLLDLQDVEFISSAGIRVLLLSSRETEARGGRWAMCGLNEYCREVITTTGMVDVLPRFENIEEALVYCRTGVMS